MWRQKSPEAVSEAVFFLNFPGGGGGGGGGMHPDPPSLGVSGSAPDICIFWHTHTHTHAHAHLTCVRVYVCVSYTIPIFTLNESLL